MSELPMFDDEDLPRWLVAGGVTYAGQYDPIAGLPTPPWRRPLKYHPPEFAPVDLPPAPWRAGTGTSPLSEPPLADKPLPPWANPAMVQASAFSEEVDLDLVPATAPSDSPPEDPFADIDWLADAKETPPAAAQPAGESAWIDEIDLFAGDRGAASLPTPSEDTDLFPKTGLTGKLGALSAAPDPSEAPIDADFSLFDDLAMSGAAIPSDPFADIPPTVADPFAEPVSVAPIAPVPPPPPPAELNWLSDFEADAIAEPPPTAQPALNADFFASGPDEPVQAEPARGTGPLNLDAFLTDLPDNTAATPAPPAPAAGFDLFAGLGDIPDIPDIPDTTMTPEIPERPAAPATSSDVPDWLNTGALPDLSGLSTPTAPPADSGSPSWLDEAPPIAASDSKPKTQTPIEPAIPIAIEVPEWLRTDFLAEPTPTPKPPPAMPPATAIPEPTGRRTPPPADLDLDLGGANLENILGAVDEPAIPQKLTTAELQAILPDAPIDLTEDLDFDSLIPPTPSDAAMMPKPPTAPGAGFAPNFPADFGPSPLSAAPPPDLNAVALPKRSTAEIPAPEPSAALPEWVADLKPTAGPVVIRIGDQQIPMEEQPLAALPESIKQLRERLKRIEAESPTPSPTPSPAPSSLIAGLKDILPPAAVTPTPDAPAPTLSGVIISDMQARRVKALQTILSAQEQLLRRSQAGEVAAKVPKRRRNLTKLDRIAVTILLLITVILPFFAGTGGLFPPLPTLESLPAPDQARFAAVIGALEAVPNGAAVLVAIEYTPLSAGELDIMARAVISRLLDRGVRPVFVSTNPAGALYAFHLAAKIGGPSRQPGQDYIVLGLVPGTIGGVRALANPDGPLWERTIFGQDIENRPTGLDSAAISDLLSLPAFVLAQSQDDIRAWAEQYRTPDGTGRPIALLVTASAGAVATAYVSAEPQRFGGPISGPRDGLIFSAAAGYPAPRAAERWDSFSLTTTMAAMMLLIGAAFGGIRSLRKGQRR